MVTVSLERVQIGGVITQVIGSRLTDSAIEDKIGLRLPSNIDATEPHTLLIVHLASSSPYLPRCGSESPAEGQLLVAYGYALQKWLRHTGDEKNGAK